MKKLLLLTLIISAAAYAQTTTNEENCRLDKGQLLEVLKQLNNDDVESAYNKLSNLVNENCAHNSKNEITSGIYKYLGGVDIETGERIKPDHKILKIYLQGRGLLDSFASYTCNSERTLCVADVGVDCKNIGVKVYNTYHLAEDGNLVFTNACGSLHYYKPLNK